MADTDPNCLFCQIVAGDVPADVIHRDDQVVVFRDINPRAPTHVLAIPRRHVPSAAELTETDGELLAALFGALRRVAEDGCLHSYRIVTNVGPDSGQSVLHLHLHLLGGRPMSWPPG